MVFVILERLADIEIWKTNQDGWKEKKSYLKNVLLKWFTFWKQGSLKRMHSIGSLYPTKHWSEIFFNRKYIADLCIENLAAGPNWKYS